MFYCFWQLTTHLLFIEIPFSAVNISHILEYGSQITQRYKGGYETTMSGSISPSEVAGEEADWTFKAINSLIPSNRLLLSPQSPKQLRKSKMHIHHLILWCCKCEVLYLILLNSFKHFFPTTVKPKLGSNFEIILVPSCCCLNLPFSILMSVNCFFFP